MQTTTQRTPREWFRAGCEDALAGRPTAALCRPYLDGKVYALLGTGTVRMNPREQATIRAKVEATCEASGFDAKAELESVRA